jgi:hypothetical protein
VEIGEEEKEIRFLEAEQSPLAIASLDMNRCFVHPFTRYKQAKPTFIPAPPHSQCTTSRICDAKP